MTVTNTRPQERIDFMRGMDEEMRNRKDSHMFNTINQQIYKMNKRE
jgi:hypothetical protein